MFRGWYHIVAGAFEEPGLWPSRDILSAIINFPLDNVSEYDSSRHMRSFFAVYRPDEIEFTMTTTMKLGKWRAIRDALRGDAAITDVAITDFRLAIMQMIQQAERNYHPEQKQDDGKTEV